MKITEALNDTVCPEHRDCETLFLNGSISKDGDDDFFRLFPDPGNYRSYFLIRHDDVTGELYEWSTAECASARIFGTRIFRVPLAAGTVVQSVEITLERVGETVEGMPSHRPSPIGDASRCRASTGCGSKPCCDKRGLSEKCLCSLCCVA